MLEHRTDVFGVEGYRRLASVADERFGDLRNRLTEQQRLTGW